MKTKSGLATPASRSACSAASRPARFGLWCRLMPTPAVVVMGIPPSPQVHISLEEVVWHLLVAAPSRPYNKHTGRCLRVGSGEAPAGESWQDDANRATYGRRYTNLYSRLRISASRR